MKRRLKIGVIDSGISKEFLKLHPVQIGASANFHVNWTDKTLDTAIYTPQEVEAWRNDAATVWIHDESGHGTDVVSILHRELGDSAEFHIVKILDAYTSGYTLTLLEGMRWLLDTVQPDCINLSLGTTNQTVFRPMQALVAQAQAQNCTLFSAAGDKPTYPSELPGVTAVANRALALDNSTGVKIDCVVLPETIRVFHRGNVAELPMTTSYAAPLALSQHYFRGGSERIAGR